MAFRSTRIYVHNETDTTLRLVEERAVVDRGEWTPSCHPPKMISPGESGWWQTESDGVLEGTEGRVAFRVGQQAGRELAMHWVNPAVGPNFFEQWISGPYGLYFSGGKGDTSVAEYHLISDSRVWVAGYRPSRHGFAFSNAEWPNFALTTIDLPYPLPDIEIGNASWGLCGGMSFASRDYYEARTFAPTQPTHPGGEGDELFDYIVARAAQSMLPAITDYLIYGDPLYPSTDDVLGAGHNWVMAHESWPRIRETIDSGHPCPIQLLLNLLPDVANLGHVVCVYAYQLQGQTLTMWAYDPNRPRNDDVSISLDMARTDQQPIVVSDSIGPGDAIRCFFPADYARRAPVNPVPLPTRALAIDRSGGLRQTWLDLGTDDGWLDPSPVGATILQPSAPLAVFRQSPEVWTALTTTRDGHLAVAWSDPALRRTKDGTPQSGNAGDLSWRGPTAIGTPGLPPGAPIATFQQNDHTWAALATNIYGQLTVAWLDLKTTRGWQGPIPFGPAILHPKAPITAFRQSPTVIAALTTTADGHLAVAWLDLKTTRGWRGPTAIGTPGLPPGAPIATFQQNDHTWAALATNIYGQLTVAWLDLKTTRGWQGPIPFGPAILHPKAPITAFRQSPTVIAALTTTADGHLAVAWLDLKTTRGWRGPTAIGTPGLPPGAPIATFQQNDHTWAALATNIYGQLTVAWLDLKTTRGWQGPIPFGPAILHPKAPITAFRQSPTVVAALTTTADGHLAVAWLDLKTTRGWQGPTPFGEAVFPPGAPGAVASALATA